MKFLKKNLFLFLFSYFVLIDQNQSVLYNLKYLIKYFMVLNPDIKYYFYGVIPMLIIFEKNKIFIIIIVIYLNFVILKTIILQDNNP